MPPKDKSTETDAYGYGLQTVGLIGDLWSGYQQYKAVKEQNKLARESFEFNKDLSTKNFNLAKEDHDRRVRKSENISTQYADSSKEWKKRNASVKPSTSPTIATENARRNRANQAGA